ncbi:MAG: PA domain-containing protein [Luteimonas sp.]
MNKVFLACALAIAGIGQAAAANIVILNVDPPGSGLNDPKPAQWSGGNPGTTIGEQRRIVFQFAADQWGAILQSNVKISIESSFASLTCDVDSGTLAQAGALNAFANFPNAPVANSFYNVALANALAATDLDPDDDIQMTFQADLGKPDCLAGSGWYYGLDGVTPSGKTNFLDTAMHEMGHGLNFQGRYNLATGAPPAPGFTDIYSTLVFDNATSKNWTAMTNAQRVVAAKADALVWKGAAVTAQTSIALSQRTDLFLTGKVNGSFQMVTAGYGPIATPANFGVGAIVLANDGSANPTLGCAATAPDAYAGKIVLIDRGTCSFKLKTLNAQNSGAAKVIVANNVADGFPGMGEDPNTPATITIPAIGVSQTVGNVIKPALPGVNGALQFVPGQLAGADNTGHARLYAPAALAQGSSFSHFDVSLSPDAIMEPFDSATTDANFRLDLTPALFKDIGWVLNPGKGLMRNGTCSSGVKVLQDPGLIAGANLQASDKMCRATYGNGGKYRTCLNLFVKQLVTAGLIPATTFGIENCSAF